MIATELQCKMLIIISLKSHEISSSTLLYISSENKDVMYSLSVIVTN